MKMLIAEDDATSRNMLAAVLRKCGYDVVATANGAQAWAALQEPNPPRLVVLDWIMPELDGLEVVRRVRAQPIDPPPYILMLTSKGGKADIISGLEGGANDYLSKPFDPGELRARVEVGRRMLELQAALADRIEELGRAMAEIKTLRGIVPICATCKKIRNDKGFWQQVEVYMHAHSEVEFSHGMCPDCLRKFYPDILEKLESGEARAEQPPGDRSGAGGGRQTPNPSRAEARGTLDPAGMGCHYRQLVGSNCKRFVVRGIAP